MCGIVGIVNRRKYFKGFSKKEVDVFSQMLQVGQLRGMDSTGIVYNTKSKETISKVLKAAYNSTVFTDSAEFDKATDIMIKESDFAIGHNRAATKGVVKADNAHPFRDGHIVLAHNGTLNQYKELADDVEVDSHAICKSITKRGAKETLEMVDGAFSLVWVDMNEGTINFCRNWQRPLYILTTADIFIICSEKEMGEWVAARNNIKVIKSEIIEAEHLYQINIKDPENYTKEKVKYKSWITTGNTYKGGSYNTWPTFNNNEDKDKLNTYHVGKMVRFRSDQKVGAFTGGIHGKLSLDLIVDQASSNTAKFPQEFEDEFRAYVYGKVENLEKFANKNYLKGEISHSYYDKTYGAYLYTIKNVEEYTPQNSVILLPSATTDKFCEWCNAPNAQHKMFQYNICDKCMEEWGKDVTNEAGGAMCQC